jgi:hypothetical protein
MAVWPLACDSHHGDDLLDPRRVGGIAAALFRGVRPAWYPGSVAGDRGRPQTSIMTWEFIASSSDCTGVSVSHAQARQAV